ncbi:kinesin-like protein KIF26B isoform X2 [Kryptolebias marmoratus]|uniref:Kinesin family member 26Ba n=1 Tax=Kryptolebias marmoratus TaxID=37003 RepID=A0A3Q3B9Q1_KRYMA|nr:kinesin-like protein KIF26B isoform X2 [Kryptolebias marmoratus]
MTSLSGTKERSSRSRKYGMPDTSPTKAASFFPETWYRKAYEETTRSGTRPAPEGAGSMPSSTGTPSPGSGISSPGSFSGSPGTTSPGIGTGSPGSLGGSPGFGTGSPASGSGSSPGSERVIWCENCNARLTELKRQALKLLIPGPYSSKDPSFSLLLHDKLQVPNSSRRAWNERDSRCDVCATHLTQLKQEAVRMVLTLDQWDLSPTSSPPALIGRYGSHGLPGQTGASGAPGGPASREWPAQFLPSSSSSSAAAASLPSLSSTQSPSPSPSQTPTPSPSHGPNPSQGSPSPAPTSSCAPTNPQLQGAGHRLGSKPSSLGLGAGVDKRSGSPSSAKATGAQQQSVTAVNSPSNNGGSSNNSSGAVLSTAALQAHQHQNRTNGGVTLYPYQISQMISEASREEGTEAALNRCNTHSPAHTNSPSHTSSPCNAPAVTTAPTATSAAASFFARAAQKLNLASKKKKHKTAAAAAPATSSPLSCDPPLFPTNFSSALLKAPPPAPPCLLRAANKIKDTPGLGKVKVMVRVCPVSQSNAAESSSFLKVDPRKKQITIMDPSVNQTPNAASQKRAAANQVPPKMFSFDAAFPPDASQAEVCAGTVAEVIQSVVNGADGCVFCFGHSKLGKSYTMIGRDDSLQTLGIIPCAISWLFKLINERKEKTGARFSVRVSAVEVWGKEENLKDLLSEVATGSLQDGQSPGVYLCEDPICGMQLQNQSELRAPTPEKAAWFLDAAIAARHNSQRPNTTEEEHRNSHMLFTLHIYQYRMEKTGKGGMSGGRSRLHLLDLGSCDVKALEGGGGGKNKENSSASLCLSLSALGNVILALVNGSKHIPYKDSKLTMLLRESLGNMNCRTTMIAHISASPRDFSESLSTIQIASRVLRMKKKKTKVTVQYTSSSSGGESSCEEGRMRRPTHLRPFHHRGDTDSELPLLRLSSDPDDYSSSEQSCDTVIYVGPNGAAVSDKELTDNEGPPEFVPIIPALLRGKTSEQHQTQSQSQGTRVQNKSQADEQSDGASQPLSQPSQSLLGQPLAPVPEEGAECLKCNTFAELQERLDCIDGSEEVSKFPFEEVPASKQSAKEESCPSSAVLCSAAGSAAVVDTEAKIAVASRKRSNDQQLQEIKEVVEEAELAQTMIHSLAQVAGCPIVTSSRSVTGSSSITSNPLHRAKSLHDSRENLNAVGNIEGKGRPLGSPRLGIASLTKTSEYRPPSSPSQRSKVYTQKGVMPATPPQSSHTLAQDSQTTDALTSDNSLAADSGRSSTESLLSRTSPAGMSPQVQEATPSLSASLGSAETLCDDDVPPIPLDTLKDVAAGAGGTFLLRQDELVYTVASGGGEDVVTVLIEAHSLACRPTSIISFNSDCGSEAALASDSQLISIVGTTASEGTMENYHIPPGLATASGVKEVVAMAEVAMAKLRIGEPLATGMSNSGSTVSSWMSDLSMGSEADQSLHSFSQSQNQQGEALADPETSLGVEGCVGCESGTNSRRGSLDGELVLSENMSAKSTPNKDKLRKLPPSMAKTNIQILAGPGNLSPFKNTKSVHPCVAVKPMILQEPTILSSPTKTQFMKDSIKSNSVVLASISSEMSFEDPWLKREMEEGMSKDLVCEVKPEIREVQPLKSNSGEKVVGGNEDQQCFCTDGGDHSSSGSGGEVVSSPDSFKRVVDGCEMVTVVTQGECVTGIYNPDIHHTGSLPRGWHRLNYHDGLDSGMEYCNLGVTTSTPCSPRATLDRLGSRGKQSFFSHKKGGIPPLPPVRKSSLDQRNRAASPLHLPSHGVSTVGSTADNAGTSGSAPAGISRQRGSSIDSSRLFSAKLEQLANRTNSLGRANSLHSGSHHYDCFSLERGESLRGGGGGRGDTTMPRTGRSLTRAGSVPSPTGNPSSPNFSGSTSPSSAPQSPAKTSSQSKISAVSKLLMTSSPKARSLSASSTKTLIFSTKSLSQTTSRSSSLPPNGKNSVQGPLQQQGPAHGSWSTQSLSRSRGGSLTAKLPLRAVNSRISELLQGSAGSRSRNHVQGGGTDRAETKDNGGTSGGGAGGDSGGEEKAAVVQTLPSPYSKITAPRKPHRCSSGHASDNSSVLSGELPPAMGKTALFYHSGGSSGYESMLRDSSENTGSTSSAQDSLSEHSSATTSSRRSSKSSKKSRSNTGLQRRRLIPALTLDSSSSPSQRSSKQAITSSSSSSSSPGACWVDGPLGPPASSNHRGAATATETFEIKVYEIDDVERLQKRRDKGGSKEVVYVSAKLRLLEHRQQRISEVRAKYQCLKRELEQTKQHLMLEPHKWTTEFELQQHYDVDSVEYLEALETVTDKLETRVNFCKAHLMMITCFDVSSRHR